MQRTVWLASMYCTLVVLTLGIWQSSSARAALVTASQAAPSGPTVIISQPTFDSGSDFTTVRDWGQSFLTSAAIAIDKVTTAVTQAGSSHPSQDMILTLGRVHDAKSCNSDADLLTSTIPATQGTFAVGSIAAPWYITLDIPSSQRRAAELCIPGSHELRR